MGSTERTTGEPAGEEEHPGPAERDWPRGFGEATWWPLVTGLGVAGIYLGAGLFLLGRGPDPLVPPVLAPLAIVPGVGLFLAGLYGWLYHGFVAEYWLRAPAGEGVDLRWGMVLFLATDVMTFGAGFVYYFFVRTGPWPPGELPPLLSWLVLGNTLVLVVSSGTLHVADVALRDDDRRRFLVALAATVMLGVVFVAGQVLEYYEFLVVEEVAATSVYFSAFFGLTGLHGLHVTLGVVLLAIVLARALAGQFSAERHTAVATVSMYWHFVDAVWLFLVVSLYAGAT